jgi:hypothetical protein
MKWKFIMMTVLIQDSKQPGNDIVYLKPLVEELLPLWVVKGEVCEISTNKRNLTYECCCS